MHNNSQWVVTARRESRGRSNHDRDSRTDATPRITIRDVRNVTFRAAGSLLRRLTLTEEWDLGPFVSVWVS
jgi:hypothetical protein